MRTFSSLFCAALIFFIATSASAVSITVNDVTGSWQNALPLATTALSIVNGIPTSTISWGTPFTSAGPSSYVFTSDVPPPVGTVIPPSPTAWLDFGDFTHNNNPITGTPLTSVELSLVVGLNVDGNLLNKTFLYQFTHTETPNSPPCPFGPALGPCADRASLSPPLAGVFDIGGVTYTLELRFSTDGGVTTTNDFITQEGQANPADLYGRFTSEITPIPEPSSLLLLGSGLFGALGYGVRRFRATRGRR